MRIGIIFMGNESDRIWGGGIITHYLAEALEELGHEIWREPIFEWPKWAYRLDEPTDLLISHGVPASRIPSHVWQNCQLTIYWWLSALFYCDETMAASPFNAVATNSLELSKRLTVLGKPAKYIQLAASPLLSNADVDPRYQSFVTYLGVYPHKTPGQLDKILEPATEVGLTIWGRGWEQSPYRDYYKGVLPFDSIGSLYRSCRVVLALTEEQQKAWGMINNRIFEALITGSIVISDTFPSLQSHELGRYLSFVDSQAGLRLLLSLAKNPDSRLDQMALEGQRVVLAGHTFHERAKQFLELFGELGTHDTLKGNARKPYSEGVPIEGVRAPAMLWDQLAAAVYPEGGYVDPPGEVWSVSNVSVFKSTDSPAPTVVRVKYPSGSASPTVTRQTGAPRGGIQFLVRSQHAPVNRIGLRYNLRFADDFPFVKGGKLPGLFGGSVWSGGNIPDGTNGFSTRYMWRENGHGEIYLYVPGCEKFGLSLGRGNWTFRAGVWHRIEQQIVLNEPGKNDGVVRVWFDGKSVLEQRNVLFRTVSELKVEGVLFSTFFGGGDISWCTPIDTSIQFCGFRVSTDVPRD